MVLPGQTSRFEVERSAVGLAPRLGAVGWSVLSLVGCYNTERVCSQALDYEATVELGTWSNGSFADLEDGDVLSPVFGPQGGQHLAAAVVATGVNPGNGEMVEEGGGFLDFLFPSTGTATVANGRDPVSLTFRVEYEGGLIEPSRVVFETFLDGSVESATSLEQTVFMNYWQIAEAYPEQEFAEATLRVRLVDSCGTSLEDSREIRIPNPDYGY